MEKSTISTETYKMLLKLLKYYLIDGDVGKVLSYADENIYAAGITDEKISLNKDEFKAVLISRASILTFPVLFTIQEYHEKELADDIIICCCDLYTASSGAQMEQVRMHVTLCFKREVCGYKVHSIHISNAKPSVIQNDFITKDIIGLLKQFVPGGITGCYEKPGFPIHSVIEAAMRDPLTNLYNRRAMPVLMTNYGDADNIYAFVILDIDAFKTINDTYGHQAGDNVLLCISKILTDSFMKKSIAFRLGGDEFIIFINGNMKLEEVEAEMDEICAAYKYEVEKMLPKHKTSLSYGGIIGNDTISFDIAYAKADAILYEVKKNGKDKGVIKPLF